MEATYVFNNQRIDKGEACMCSIFLTITKAEVFICRKLEISHGDFTMSIK